MRSGAGRVSVDERLRLDAALEEAFAPLRGHRSNVAAARVRAAVRWSSPAPCGLRGLALLARVSELTVAVAISALVFAGSVESLIAVPSVPDVAREAAPPASRMLNGRLAYQPPIGSNVIDVRRRSDEVAVNAASVRRPESPPALEPLRGQGPF